VMWAEMISFPKGTPTARFINVSEGRGVEASWA
jgi:hypothetical protein